MNSNHAHMAGNGVRTFPRTWKGLCWWQQEGLKVGRFSPSLKVELGGVVALYLRECQGYKIKGHVVRVSGQRGRSTDGCLDLRGCTLTGQAASKGQGHPDFSSAASPLPALAPGSPVSTRPSSPGSQGLPGHPVIAGTSPRPWMTTGFRH